MGVVLRARVDRATLLQTLSCMGAPLVPHQAPRTCTYSGCKAIVSKGRCEQHETQGTRAAAQAHDAHRLPSSQRGYDGQWRITRDEHLAEFPLCALCLKNGRATSATCVDHIIPIAVNPDLLYDVSNIQSLCTACHSIKTAMEDGGFGNARVTGGSGRRVGRFGYL